MTLHPISASVARMSAATIQRLPLLSYLSLLLLLQTMMETGITCTRNFRSAPTLVSFR